MPRFPYMGFPFPYYKSSPRSPQNFSASNFSKATDYKPYSNHDILKPACDCEPKIQEPCFNDRQKNKSNNNDDYLFDLFGLKLYTDDVLLVSLIYFLYSEGVKDESLFIVLMLLLLS